MAKNKKKKANRSRERILKKRQLQRRNRIFRLGGIGIAILAIAFFAFSGGANDAPISEGLSEDEVAALPAAPKVGSRAPDFMLSDVDGNSFSLNNALGKPIVIMFFHSWWPPCNQSAPEVRRAEIEFGDDLTILFVDQEEPLQPVLDFAARYSLTSTFLMDPSGEIGSRYQLFSTPTAYFVDPRGVVQDINVGVVTFNWIEANLERSLQWVLESYSYNLGYWPFFWLHVARSKVNLQ